MKRTTMIVLLCVAVFGATALIAVLRSEKDRHVIAKFFGFAAVEQNDQVYWCPMHPHYKVKKTGMCPYCNMALEPYQTGAGDLEKEPTLVLTDQQIQQAGVRTEKIRRRALVREISTSGIISKNFDKYWHIDVKFDGWVEELYLTSLGQKVKVGQPIAKLYSPKIYATQKEYLLAKDDPELGPAARKRLELLGINEREIKELEKRGTPTSRMTLRSPYAGWVLHQDVHAAGERLPQEDPIGHILDIGDLRELWLFADVYTHELNLVKVGQAVRIQADAYPGETFTGVVDLIDPIVNVKTQTVRARIIVKNDPVKLMIGQFVRVLILNEIPDTLAVSEQAVIPTGRREIVIVSRGGGRFAAREVEIGRKYLTEVRFRNPSRKLPFFTGHNRYHEILSGLDEGEVVVTSGAFLLHAETQIRQLFEKMIGAPKDKGPVRSAWSGEMLESPQMMDGLPFHDKAEQQRYAENPENSWRAKFPDVEKAMSSVFDQYFRIHSAVVKKNLTLGAEYAEAFLPLVEAVPKPIMEAFSRVEADRIRKINDDLVTSGRALKQAKSAKEQSRRFGGLNAALESWLEAYGSPKTQIYQFYCGMANGMVGSPSERWFQLDDELRNPYGMEGCGRVEKTLRKAKP